MDPAAAVPSDRLSPSACEPGLEQAAFFVDANFGGQCIVKGYGVYNNANDLGLPNDSISSIKVGGNVQVNLCQDNNLGGVCELFATNWSDLSSTSVGSDTVSSANVQIGLCSPGPNQAGFYTDSNYGGQCVLKEIGVYNNAEAVGLPNDSMSSLKVGANVVARLCQDNNLTGTCQDFTTYVPSLVGSVVGNDTVSSASVAARPKPDLRPYTSSTFPYPVVPSSVAGTHEVGPLYVGQPTYFDYQFTNSGNATAVGPFYVEVWVDSVRFVRAPFSNVATGQAGGADDVPQTILTTGRHDVRIVIDPDNLVAESDKSNNTWNCRYFWGDPPQPPPTPIPGAFRRFLPLVSASGVCG